MNRVIAIGLLVNAKLLATIIGLLHKDRIEPLGAGGAEAAGGKP